MATYAPGSNFLSVEEVAHTYRISRSTVYRLIADGKLPAFRIRGQHRVSRVHVDALMRPPATSIMERNRGRQ